MFVIIGAITVLVCVFGGFALHGGNLAVLWQPTELIIIGGAAVGGMISSSHASGIKETIHQITHALKGNTITKQQYTELLVLMFELFKAAKANPLSLEPHVEKPETSDIFKKSEYLLHNHHALNFFCDTLKVQVSSPLSPFDLEELMDKDIRTLHEGEHQAPTLISKTGDALPGLGIVAAVLGVVQTMGHLTEGKEVIGHSVAAALVGTFLGILLSYGFLQPLAAKMEVNLKDSGQYLEVIKAGILAYAKNCSPKVCIEFARRTIPDPARPSFEETDQATSGAKKAA